jgi:type III restriction enzyme
LIANASNAGDWSTSVSLPSRSNPRLPPDLMGMKNVLAINDEVHHCYREKPVDDGEFVDGNGNPLTGQALKEAEAQAKEERITASLTEGSTCSPIPATAS